MNLKILLALLLVALVTNGASCVNDGFLIAVDFPIRSTYNINAGPNTAFGGQVIVKVSEQLGSSYRNNLQSARYYDIRVSMSGAYAGNVSGTAYINSQRLLDYSGQWLDFETPQSLLGGSPHVIPQTAGINELVRILNSLQANPEATITLSSTGNMSQGPVPAGLSVTVTIYAQADTQVK